MTLKECIILRRKLLSVPIKKIDERHADFGYGITGTYKELGGKLIEVSLSNGNTVKVSRLNAVPDYVRLDGAVRDFGNGYKLHVVSGTIDKTKSECIVEYTVNNKIIARGMMKTAGFKSCIPVNLHGGEFFKWNGIAMHILSIGFKGGDLVVLVRCIETRLSTYVNLSNTHITNVQDLKTGLTKENIYQLLGNNKGYTWTMDGYCYKDDALLIGKAISNIDTDSRYIKSRGYGSKDVWEEYIPKRMDNNKKPLFCTEVVYSCSVGEKIETCGKCFEIIAKNPIDNVVYIKTSSGSILAVHDYHVPNIDYWKIGL